jgi:tRNA(Ser,Leu) C12 N-acetylase TAN1
LVQLIYRGLCKFNDIIFLLFRHFPATTDSTSFAIVFKKRNNDKVSRPDAIEAAAAAIIAHSPQSKVNLDAPDKVLCIDVVGKTMCLAVIDEYNQMRRYSLHPPAPPQSTTTTTDDAVEAE